MSKSPLGIMLDGVEWRVRAEPLTHSDGLPWATHEGVLEIMGRTLRCYRLNTGQTIFNADDVAALFDDATQQPPQQEGE